jgi:hypothetical protein
MELIVKKIIGSTVYPFTFSGKNLHEVVMQSQMLSFPNVHECGICKSDDLYLSAHVAENKFKYTEIRCNKCRAELTFGQRQNNPDVFYLRRNDDQSLAWKPFSPAENNVLPPETGSGNGKPQTSLQGKNNTKASGGKQAGSQAGKKDKPSGHAINLATKISIAKDNAALEALRSSIKNAETLSATDLIYLRNEYTRRSNLLAQQVNAIN